MEQSTALAYRWLKTRLGAEPSKAELVQGRLHRDIAALQCKVEVRVYDSAIRIAWYGKLSEHEHDSAFRIAWYGKLSEHEHYFGSVQWTLGGIYVSLPDAIELGKPIECSVHEALPYTADNLLICLDTLLESVQTALAGHFMLRTSYRQLLPLFRTFTAKRLKL